MRPTRLLALSAAVLLGASALAACGSDDDGGADGAAETTTTTSAAASPTGDDTAGPADCVDSEDVDVSASAEFGSEPEIEVGDGAPPCELVVVDLEKGEGAAVEDVSKRYSWNYEGVAWSTKEVFDSSFDRGAPIDFSLDQVIDGWTEGLQGIRPGGRRLLVIPPDQAYGAAGAPPAIGPDETLVFVVDLVEPA